RTHFSYWLLARRNGRRTCDVEMAVPFIVVERTVGTDRRRLYSREPLHTFEQLRPKRGFLFLLFVFRLRQRNHNVQYSTRIETERRILRVPETLQSQTCPRQQNNCERNLRNHQSGTHSLSARPVA